MKQFNSAFILHPSSFHSSPHPDPLPQGERGPESRPFRKLQGGLGSLACPPKEPCMPKKSADDSNKEKFRPDTSALDREVENALGGMSLDDLYRVSAPQQQGPAESYAKGTRKGKIISVTPDDVMVDFGGKSQGI